MRRIKRKNTKNEKDDRRIMTTQTDSRPGIPIAVLAATPAGATIDGITDSKGGVSADELAAR